MLLLKSLVAAIIAATLAGCAQPGKKTVEAGTTLAPAQNKEALKDLAPGEQVDYAGHRCGNPNLHIKTHLCIFPRR